MLPGPDFFLPNPNMLPDRDLPEPSVLPLELLELLPSRLRQPVFFLSALSYDGRVMRRVSH